MKKLFIMSMALMFAVAASAAGMELSGKYRSRFIPSVERNSYKNILSLKVDNVDTKRSFRVERVDVTGWQTEVATLDIDEGGYYEIYYNYGFVLKQNVANRYDNDEPVEDGNVNAGESLEIVDYFLGRTYANLYDILDKGGDTKGPYTYKIRDLSTRQYVCEFEVPVYAAHVTADFSSGYSLDEIMEDTEHQLAPTQVEVSVSNVTPGANIASWKFFKGVSNQGVNVDEVFSTSSSFTDEITFVNQSYMGEITVISPDGVANTYGTNEAFIFAGIISGKSTQAEKSTYEFTSINGETGCHYYRNVLQLTFNYAPIGTTERLHPSITTGGYRVWRDCETAAEMYPEYVGRATDNLFYERMDVSGKDDNRGKESQTNVGNDGNQLGDNFMSGIFGASGKQVKVDYRVRAYYHRTMSEYNPQGAPARHAPALKVDEPKQYFIAEYVFPYVFSESIVTSVQDMGAKQVSSVKYYNLAGIESSEAFDGVNIVVTHYNDGTKSVSKVIR